MYVLKTRYIVFRVPIKGAGINIEKISQKIPKDFVLITGYKATVRKQSVGGIPDATISLSFNNKASNPIVIDADMVVNAAQDQKEKYLQLEEQVQDGTYIQGYMESNNDYGGACYVKITLRGKKIIKID